MDVRHACFRVVLSGDAGSVSEHQLQRCPGSGEGSDEARCAVRCVSAAVQRCCTAGLPQCRTAHALTGEANGVTAKGVTGGTNEHSATCGRCRAPRRPHIHPYPA